MKLWPTGGWTRTVLPPGAPAGRVQHTLRPGEGEFVCTTCDGAWAATTKPRKCPFCGGGGVETLTRIAPGVNYG